MTRQTFQTNYLKTIDWLNGNIVDWVSAGQLYSSDGQQSQIAKYHYAFKPKQHEIYQYLYFRFGLMIMWL